MSTPTIPPLLGFVRISNPTAEQLRQCIGRPVEIRFKHGFIAGILEQGKSFPDRVGVSHLVEGHWTVVWFDEKDVKLLNEVSTGRVRIYLD